MIPLERPVRFEEVDAAGIVFFGHFIAFAHDALEHFFASLAGGYPTLITERRVGFPAVHVEMSFSAPVRYGDALRIETTTTKIGTRSATLRYRMFRKSDGALAAEIWHTVVTTDLSEMKSCEMPADVRAVLVTHLEGEEKGS